MRTRSAERETPWTAPGRTGTAWMDVEVAGGPEPPPWRPIAAIAACLGALAVAVGVVIVDDGAHGGADPRDAPRPTASAAPAGDDRTRDPGTDRTRDPGAAPTVDLRDGRSVDARGDAPATELPGPLPFPKSAVGPGTYTTELLGVPMAIVLPDAWRLERAVTGTIHLVDPDTGSLRTGHATPGRELLARRIGGWSDGGEADDPFGGPGTIGPLDVEGWVAANDVLVHHRPGTTVAGRPTRVFDAVVDPTSDIGLGVCVPDERPCLYAASVSAESERSNVPRRHHLAHDRVHRYWLVEVGELDPILLRAATAADDAGWLDEVDASTIPFIGLGPDAPPRPAG